MLQAGRADYLLDYRYPSEKALKKVNIPDIRSNQISSLPCYFIVSMRRNDGQDIIKNLETVFKTMKADGTL